MAASRRALKLALAIAALGVTGLVASPASAQLPPILPPPDVPGGPGNAPSQGTSSPGGEALSYDANPSRTGAASEGAVFGPLAKAWQVQTNGGVNQTLVADGKLLASASNVLYAFDPATGNLLWQQTVPGFSTIAADADRVVAVQDDGTVRGFSIGDGTEVWSRESSGVDPGSSPVAADGAVYLWRPLTNSSSSGRLEALSVADGSTIWSTQVQISVDGTVAIDSQRAYVVDHCGNAVAIARSTGLIAWSHTGEQSNFCTMTGNALVADGVVFAGDGRRYDAQSGEQLDRLIEGQPQAAHGGVGFIADTQLRAFELTDGVRIWDAGVLSNSPPLEPVIAAGTVFVGTDASINSYEEGSGRLLWEVGFPDEALYESGGQEPGVTVAAGKLFASQGAQLVAYAPVLQPAADGIDIASTGFDVDVGDKVFVVGGVGATLRPQHPEIVLQRDPAPFKKLKGAGQFTAFDDGTTYFKTKPQRNTRFAVSAGGAVSDSFVVRAYAKQTLNVRPAGRGFGQATLRVKKAKAKPIAGLRAYAYLNPAKSRKLKRLGHGGRLRATGKKDAAARIRFRVPRNIGKHDLIYGCVDNLERIYGRADVFTRHCGAKRAHLPPKGKANSPASASPPVSPAR